MRQRRNWEAAGHALPGIDTVNVRHVDLSLKGHGYISSSRMVLTDLHQVLTSGLEPSRRASMRGLLNDGGLAYWELSA